jgi:hypothetical protein
MDNKDPAAPYEVDECKALIACLSDDAELLRRANPECEIAANMEAAADMLEKLRAREPLTDTAIAGMALQQADETSTAFIFNSRRDYRYNIFEFVRLIERAHGIWA